MTGVRVNSALAAYPVGAIYLSVSATSPAALFGGTWERIAGRFLLAATDGGAAGGNSNASIAAGGTGGEASHVLTPAETAAKSHSHGPGTLNVTASGRHQHSYYYQSKKAASGSAVNTAAGSGAASAASYKTSSETHTHPASSFSGATAGLTEANGSAHNNMPPYLAVYVWKRTA